MWGKGCQVKSCLGQQIGQGRPCVWAWKDLQKLQISKSTPKGDISFFLIPFQELQWTFQFGLQSCFPVFVTSQKYIPLMEIWMVGGWGEAWLSNALFQIQNLVQVFLYHCISDGNRLFSENVGCHFHFILHIMSDKAALVSWALICVQRYQGNLELSNSASRWQGMNLHICQ